MADSSSYTEVGPHCFKQAEGTDDVGLDEVFRAVDAAVDVRFGGKIDNGAGLVLGEQFGDEVEVADVTLDEGVARVSLERGEVFEVAGVGQRIEVDDGLVGMGQPVEDEVAADEAGAACDEDIAH